jgi:predicted O-linked N-acetylglucosamine transferase (SPINDLY family)
VDFRLVDSTTDPAGADSLATERLIRINPCFLCFRPLAESPPVSEAPCEKQGFITLGSFNVLDKVSEATLDAWSAVLKRAPDSKLILKSKPLADATVRERTHQAFSSRGIDPSRIELIGWAGSLRDHLALYSSIDIALDTFPYNGTTTTCEALWMGVPVVTVRGGVHAARVGASLLSDVGLRELVAADVEGYIQTVAALASDRPRIAKLRAEMRARIQASPLRDEKAFVGRYEAALRTLWRDWCAARKA